MVYVVIKSNSFVMNVYVFFIVYFLDWNVINGVWYDIFFVW